MKITIFLGIIIASCVGYAAQPGDYLVRFADHPNVMKSKMLAELPVGTKITDLGFKNWGRVQIPSSTFRSFGTAQIKKIGGVALVQPNYNLRIYEQPDMAAIRTRLLEAKKPGQPEDDCPIPGLCDIFGGGGSSPSEDNPAIPEKKLPGTGADPFSQSQWGMIDIGAQKAWSVQKGNSNIVVAVIDTGVDYTHEDLVENLWRNPGETGTDSAGKNKATNGIDDDNNGFIDDIIGWDFVSDDNKPYDLSVGPIDLLFGGGNPGHGTHCAGNVAARGFNGRGISGVAPHVSIMPIRFLSEKGQGTTDGAIQSILYAIKNGANVMSNSWGSEGEDPNDGANNQALRDAVQFAQEKGVLFVAAAGNGRSDGLTSAVGYNNDTDPKPGIPASYPHDIIISVAAIDSNNALGTFSNFGKNTVDIAAPGVKVFSTTVGGKYSDMVIDLEALGIQASWDGTSMATPHVAGAAALYLSAHPNATWMEVKKAILNSVTPVPALSDKLLTGGKLNIEKMFK